jgi:hypothetical protein
MVSGLETNVDTREGKGILNIYVWLSGQSTPEIGGFEGTFNTQVSSG